MARGTHAPRFIKYQEKPRNGTDAKNGIRNEKLDSSTGSLIGIFKYAKVRGRNKKKELECPSAASVRNKSKIMQRLNLKCL